MQAPLDTAGASADVERVVVADVGREVLLGARVLRVHRSRVPGRVVGLEHVLDPSQALRGYETEVAAEAHGWDEERGV